MRSCIAPSSLSYTYSDGINLTAVNDNVTPANSVSLSSSPANRLATANGAWGNASFSYDGVGNRSSDVNTVSGVTTTRLAAYDTVSNRITGMTENSASLRSYTYDNGGNILTDTRPGEVFAFTYNARNRPASVTRNTVAYATYGYNAFEQLVSRATSAAGGPTGTVHYIHDLDGHIIAEADAATGATAREYLWMAANNNEPTDLPLAVVDDVATTPILLMVHTDHLGRPIRMTDGSKATVWAASYKPWGEPLTISGTRALNLRFPGQYFQIETSLAYNWHRHYDPTTGRYTQPDPLGFVDGPSVYAYAGNSPFMRVDPSGRELKGGARPTNCVGIWRVYGWAAHNAFNAAILSSKSSRNEDTSGFSFNSAVDRLFRNGRPDAHDSNSSRIWELKPTTAGSGGGYFSARSQIRGYINSANGNLFRSGPPVREGDWGQLFGKQSSVTSGGFRFYPDNPSNGTGIIFYDCPPEPQSCPANDLSGIVLPIF